ncbi:MAG: hypothetical protein QXS37_05340 [Candidatus Aenigmatarchaeota archaeon]
MEVNFKTFKTDKLSPEEKLFLLWLYRLPPIYKQNKKTIPFTVAEVILCNHRIQRNDAKKILKVFKDLGFLNVVSFRGFRLNFFQIFKLLERDDVKKFINNLGLNFESFFVPFYPRSKMKVIK